MISFAVYLSPLSHVALSRNTTSESFSKSVLISIFCKFSARHGFRADLTVSRLVEANDKQPTAGTAVLSYGNADGERGLQRALHNHDLYCTGDLDQAVTGFFKILAKL